MMQVMSVQVVCVRVCVAGDGEIRPLGLVKCSLDTTLQNLYKSLQKRYSNTRDKYVFLPEYKGCTAQVSVCEACKFVCQNKK